MQNEAYLRLEGINKTFFGNYVLKDIDLEIFRGEVHALLGENGAGKSTLIKIIAGIYQKDSGNIYFDGKQENINSIQDAEKLGVSYINQEISLVPHLSVAENIYLAHESLGRFGLLDKNAQIQRTAALLDQYGLDLDPRDIVSKLSIAQQQMVEIARALSKNASLIIMDEPTSSLSNKEVDILFNAIRSLKQKGVAIIYISHRLDELYQIAERVTILRDGLKIGTYMLENETVNSIVEKMIGSEIRDWYPTIHPNVGKEILRVENLSSKWKIKNVNLSIRSGELVGLYGLLGTGRTETIRMICGLDHKKSGKIYIDGKETPVRNPWDAIDNGIMLVPEDRKNQGLVLSRNTAYNMTLAILKELLHGVKYNFKSERELFDQYVEKLSIKLNHWDQPVLYLSGGNQQKIVIAKWLCAKPKLLILDEPTRGIDVKSKKQIYDLIAELVASGVGVLLISSDLPEIVNLSTRVIIMHNGSIKHELQHDEIDANRILSLAMG